jgi:hypothetical protein
VQQLTTFALFSLLVLLLCLVRPGAGRIFMGIFFLVMAISASVQSWSCSLRTFSWR